jgi:hypothetical protein
VCLSRPGADAFQPTKKPQPEARFQKRFLRAAALPSGPSLGRRTPPCGGILRTLITSGVPSGWRENSAVKSMVISEMLKFSAFHPAAYCCSLERILRVCCAAQQFRQMLIFEANQMDSCMAGGQSRLMRAM